MLKILNIIFTFVCIISIILIGIMYFLGSLTYGNMLIIALIILIFKLFILAYEYNKK